jgi:hypothetical protein
MKTQTQMTEKIRMKNLMLTAVLMTLPLAAIASDGDSSSVSAPNLALKDVFSGTMSVASKTHTDRAPATQEHRGFKICKQVREAKLRASCTQMVNSAKYFDRSATIVCDAINGQDAVAVKCLSAVRNRRYPRTNDVWQCWQLFGSELQIECLRRSGQLIR